MGIRLTSASTGVGVGAELGTAQPQLVFIYLTNYQSHISQNSRSYFSYLNLGKI